MIPERALRLVASCFREAEVQSALELVRNDAVQLVKPPPFPVVGRVRGGPGFVVTAHFNAASGHVHGECSCPAGAACEHVAAVGLLAFARERDDLAGKAEAARQSVVVEWLAELGQATRARAPSTDDRAIVYLLDLREGELGLTVMQCSRHLKDGTLGAGAVVGAPGDPRRGPPSWVSDDDLRRIGLLRAVTRAPPQLHRLRIDRLHGALLRELAESGALHWMTTRGPPLRWGATRRSALRWQEAPELPGTSRLGIEPELVLLPARECHYLDAQAGTLGPLEVGLPAELVSRLVTGPPVPASMRGSVERSLQPLLSREKPRAPSPDELPRPRLYARIEAEGAHPRVRLEGEALYGEVQVPLAAWDGSHPLARDLLAEASLRERLRGLVERMPHGARCSTSLELLTDARYVVERVLPALRAEGWSCVLSEDFPLDAPEAAVEWVEQLRPLGDAPDWFALELGVTIAGRTVPLLPVLLQALRDGSLNLEAGELSALGAGINLRLPEGEQVHVPAERLQRWLRPLLELELSGLDAHRALRLPAVIASDLAIEGDGLSASRKRLAALLDLAPRIESAGFAGTLRPYQRAGLAWLRLLHDAGHGGVLADEMGLGKTVQVIAFLEGLREDGALDCQKPALIVAPLTVCANWRSEAARFAAALQPTVHLGAGRERSAAALTRTPLVITSYQTLLRDLERFREVRWTSVIFDEAQALKNPDTRLRRAAATLRAQSRFCLSGTPVENHLGELWSQLDLAVPGVLGRRRSFDSIFRRAIEKRGDDQRLAILHQRIRPFLLRRTKATVALDLPAKTEIVERVELDTPQRDLYESLRLKLDARVQKALTAKGFQASSMLILDALLKLRQVCCDPRLVKLPGARKLKTSAKLERLMGMLEELAASNRFTLVFSQFTEMLELIAAACASANLPHLMLTGQTVDREAIIARFQAGEVPVLLVSLKVGGVGLNLTRADTIIHYDPWWNPAAESQATSRAHRIGQDKPLTVYRLVARGTLEETISVLQDGKRQLTRAVLQDGGAAKLRPEDLQALFTPIG